MNTPAAKRRLTDWFRQWRTPLRKFLLHKVKVSAVEVDDVAQEVFLRLLRYEKAELISHPQAYLFKMASNVAAEWAIRARSRQPHEPRWLAALVADEQPESVAVRDDVQQEVARAIGTLTARQRTMLRLFFMEGLEQAEIARRLGATPRTVRRQLARSYEQLRHKLDPRLLEGIAYGRE